MNQLCQCDVEYMCCSASIKPGLLNSVIFTMFPQEDSLRLFAIEDIIQKHSQLSLLLFKVDLS